MSYAQFWCLFNLIIYVEFRTRLSWILTLAMGVVVSIEQIFYNF